MKILMITPYFPYPLVSGGQIRTYNLLKNLSSKHEITLASFIRDPKETQYLDRLKPFCQKIVVFRRRKAWSPVNILLSIITPYPFLVSIYFDPFVKSQIKKELLRDNYDLIHAETFYVMPNIPKTTVPVFLVEQVIEYLVYQRFVEGLTPLLLPLKPFLFLDVFKIKFWERHYWQKAKRLAAMSAQDQKFIQNYNPKLTVDVVANGVDIDYFAKTKRKKLQKPTVLFIGNFKWLPNRDATKYLVEDIWPLIKKEIKNCQLWIVGRNPPADIKKYGSQDIKVDGKVEDIRSAYTASSVLLAPIRNGRGTKYKILEAMATKTPIVGTSLAIEGIAAKNNNQVYIADNPKDLAQKTVNILKNPAIGRKLAQSAYSLVGQAYNWQIISSKLDRLYQEVDTRK